VLEGVLFDLDGTLLDTAPDLAAALNRLRRDEGLEPTPFERLRPYTSQGVRGLLRAGFGMTPDHPDYRRLFDRFLEHYAADLCVETQLFEGMDTLLDHLDAAGLPWGIVTNKKSRFTLPLLDALALRQRAATIVSGDTTAATKPSPLPVLHACREAGCDPRRTLFVGDDPRDIEAGRAAGTLTAAVTFGYLGDSEPVEAWGADFIAHDCAMLARAIFA